MLQLKTIYENSDRNENKRKPLGLDQDAVLN